MAGHRRSSCSRLAISFASRCSNATSRATAVSRSSAALTCSVCSTIVLASSLFTCTTHKIRRARISAGGSNFQPIISYWYLVLERATSLLLGRELSCTQLQLERCLVPLFRDYAKGGLQDASHCHRSSRSVTDLQFHDIYSFCSPCRVGAPVFRFQIQST